METIIFSSLFLLNLIASPFLIKFLRDKGFYKRKDLPKSKKVKRNKKYYAHTLANMSTPSSFGILFILNLLILLFVTPQNIETKSIILGAIFLGLLGFADDIYQFFFYKNVGEWGFKARYKMALQLTTFFLVFYLVTASPILACVFALASTFILNSFNITDGLDGLAGGIALPTFFTFGIIEYAYQGLTPLFYLTLLTFLFLFVFMVFNFKPAKVFLGDSGSYAIGAILAYLALYIDPWISLPLISLFLIEGLSSLIQIISIKVFKKRVFQIAPLHLHLLNSGWTQWQVIGTAWVLQIVIIVITLILT